MHSDITLINLYIRRDFSSLHKDFDEFPHVAGSVAQIGAVDDGAQPNAMVQHHVANAAAAAAAVLAQTTREAEEKKEALKLEREHALELKKIEVAGKQAALLQKHELEMKKLALAEKQVGAAARLAAGRVGNALPVDDDVEGQFSDEIPDPFVNHGRSGPGGEAARVAMQATLTSLHTINGKSLPIGYVTIPTLPMLPVKGKSGFKSNVAAEAASDDKRLHIIFSSGCNWAQHWESEMVLATALLVGQRGRITRIVSGCHESSGAVDGREKGNGARYHTSPAGRNDEIVPMNLVNRSSNPNFGLFVTPPFDGAKEFPWINKPTSIAYFMKHARPELDRMGETILAVLDPDFLFIKTLTMVGKADAEMDLSWNHRPPLKSSAPVDVPEKGRPVSQRYGIEGGWVRKFKKDDIVSPGSRALGWKSEDARKFVSVGPPMIHHIDDLQTLAPLWSKFMPKVLAQEKDILADMWAYSMASAELDLNHTTVLHHMISSPDTALGTFNLRLNNLNGKVDFNCADPDGSLAAHPDQDEIRNSLPTFLHYASNFAAPEPGYPKEWMFHKGHIPSNILDCNTPFVLVAPASTWAVASDKCTRDGRYYKYCKIGAWSMCTAIQKINQVLKTYKSKFCPAYEQRHLVRLVQRKTKDIGCKQSGTDAAFWCWPLAQIEGLPDDWRAKGMQPVLVANPKWGDQKEAREAATSSH